MSRLEASIRFLNTLTREKEEFKPLYDAKVSLYTCGPTVYHYAHIGNFRAYIFEDLLRRTLEYFGYEVKQVMNITDVDDKTIRGAIKEGVSLEKYTAPFTESFFNDLESLGIEKAELYPKATEYIDDMIKMIQKLLDKEIAYQGKDGSVYFAIEKFPDYGCLSHLNLEDLKAGASNRVSSDEYDKENISDFVLWKHYDKERDGEIFWESPFGRGRPGWHMECSAMAVKLLGETLDIHCGGVDNMFPHHENEIAQSESFSGNKFVRYWLHAEHLIVDGKKMAKSLGNFYTLRDLMEKGYTGRQVRYMLLQTHYRTQLNFTTEGLESVKQTLARLDDFVERILDAEGEKGDKALLQILEQAERRFSEALADDLNISVALAALFDLVRECNALYDEGNISKEEAEKILALLKQFNTVLNVLHFEKSVESVPEELLEALNLRQQARQNKEWEKADSLRDMILERGYTIEDTPSGARLKKSEGS